MKLHFGVLQIEISRKINLPFVWVKNMLLKETVSVILHFPSKHTSCSVQLSNILVIHFRFSLCMLLIVNKEHVGWVMLDENAFQYTLVVYVLDNRPTNSVWYMYVYCFVCLRAIWQIKKSCLHNIYFLKSITIFNAAKSFMKTDIVSRYTLLPIKINRLK